MPLQTNFVIFLFTSQFDKNQLNGRNDQIKYTMLYFVIIPNNQTARKPKRLITAHSVSHTSAIPHIHGTFLAVRSEEPFPEESPGCGVTSPSSSEFPSQTRARSQGLIGLPPSRFSTQSVKRSSLCIYLDTLWLRLVNTLACINTHGGTGALRNVHRRVLQRKDSGKT